MKNLKVRMKILVSFGLCLLMTLALGITSLTAVRQMDGVADNYVDVSIPATTQIWTARRAILATQKNALEIIATTNQDDLDALEASLNSESEAIDAALQELLTLMPQFETQVNQILQDMQTVRTVREKMMAECRKLTQEGNAAAYAIYKADYEPAFDKATDGVLEVYNSVNAAIAERYEQAQTTASLAIGIVIGAIVLSAAIVLIATALLSRQLTNPITEIMKAMQAVAEGRLQDADVAYESRDELGSLSDTVRTTINIFRKMVPDISHISNAFGRGDFTVNSLHPEVYVGEYAGIIDGMRYIRNTLTETVDQIDTAAAQLLTGAEQVANGAQTLSQGATEQASSVEELAATIANIEGKVKLASENAEMANRVTQEAGEGVQQSNTYMASLMDAMNDIQNSSNEIGKIIKNIDDIAFQTNILALNAAVEAARAGSAGKGFAVVADEVRNLAGKSAEAAQNTTALIENAIRAVDVGMENAQATANAMKNVAEKAAMVTDKMQDISESSAEQAEAIAQLSVGIDQIASVTQTTSATSEESAAASEELSSQAGFLKQLTGKFTLYHENVEANAFAAAEPAPAPQYAPVYEADFDFDSKY